MHTEISYTQGPPVSNGQCDHPLLRVSVTAIGKVNRLLGVVSVNRSDHLERQLSSWVRAGDLGAASIEIAHRSAARKSRLGASGAPSSVRRPYGYRLRPRLARLFAVNRS